MPDFGVNDEVNVIVNGFEMKAMVLGVGQDEQTFHMLFEDGRVAGIAKSRLLRLWGPYFDVRGQVLTRSAKHPNEVGEIVATGKSSSKKAFFRVRFADAIEEWFSEDEVFTEDIP